MDRPGVLRGWRGVRAAVQLRELRQRGSRGELQPGGQELRRGAQGGHGLVLPHPVRR